MPRIDLKLTGLLTVLLSIAAPIFGQSTEAEIKARLHDKPLYLRGFWRDKKLVFDSSGKLLNSSTPTTFTLTGFEFDSAHLKRDKLILDGKRIGTEFDKGTPKRIRFGNMEIDIGLPANGDFGHALTAIFADGLVDLVPSLPGYWQTFGNCLTQAASNPDHHDPDKGCNFVIPDKSIRQVDPVNGVSPPRIVKQVDAQFSEDAKQLKYSGSTLVSFVVTEKGLPTHLQVLRPLGLGLDEEALIAATQYRFSPSLLNGKPVTVQVNLEVVFHIY